MEKQKEKQWTDVMPESDMHDFDQESVLEGKYIELEQNVGINKSNIYHIKVAGGEVVKVWGCVTLDSRMEKVGIGADVQIELKEKVPNKYGKQTKIFAVRTAGQGDEEIPVVDEPLPVEK